MNAVVYPFPVLERRNEFGETADEQLRRECFALLEDSFGRVFADTLAAVGETEDVARKAALIAEVEAMGERA